MTITFFTLPAEPANEAARLEIVRAYGLDRPDLPADPVLDQIVVDVAARFDTPIVLVSIVTDEQQCFRACIGLDVASTPRSVSFCGHAILDTVPLVIADALLDDRFAGNPLVIGPPHIRAYAGAPLFSPEGQAIGTLCVIDVRPREHSEDDVQALVVFARSIMDRLDRLRG